jgi:hypothetical protein
MRPRVTIYHADEQRPNNRLSSPEIAHSPKKSPGAKPGQDCTVVRNRWVLLQPIEAAWISGNFLASDTIGILTKKER